ncbi:MAG TPA: hypothetical protein VEN99_07620, partial [Acidimicrobiia bacterium]|nr:hypothetical protein [Acidimicrobiia bacterium]
ATPPMAAAVPITSPPSRRHPARADTSPSAKVKTASAITTRGNHPLISDSCVAAPNYPILSALTTKPDPP